MRRAQRRRLATTLHRGAKAALRINTAWYLRSRLELMTIVSANPSPDAAKDHPSHLQVHFAQDLIDAALIDAVAAIYDGPERLHAIGREL